MTNKYIGYRKFFFDRFIKVAQNPLKKLNKAKIDSKIKLNEKELFVLKIGQTLAEIESQLSLLNFFPKLINSSNYYLEKKGFSKIAQFRYHLECYFSEIYILDQRLKKLIKILQNELEDKSKKEILGKLIKKQHEMLDGLIKTRGLHVHERKYQDGDLYYIELLDQYIKSNPQNEKVVKDEVKCFLNRNRKKWKKIIENNIHNISRSIDEIYYIVFKELELLKKILENLSSQ